MKAPRWAAMLVLVGSGMLPGCGAKKGAEEPVGISRSEGGPVVFSYDSLDQRAVSSEASKGKPTVVSFIATWDMMSQAQADFVSVMAKTDGDRVAYYLVALDDRINRELVETFARTLALACPVAVGDSDTVAGRSGFGNVAVPTTVVLDAEGRVAWRKTGLAKSDELRQVLASVERAASLHLTSKPAE